METDVMDILNFKLNIYEPLKSVESISEQF